MCYLKLFFKLEAFCSVTKYILQSGIIYSEICMKIQLNNFLFFKKLIVRELLDQVVTMYILFITIQIYAIQLL